MDLTQVDAVPDAAGGWPLSSLPGDWAEAVRDRVDPTRMRVLHEFLEGERRAGKTLHPAPDDVFAALAQTPLGRVRAVILGQDPYHGAEQAHGLSFSVQPGVRIPPSLLNIFKEIESDLGLKRPAHGNLLPWAARGVLLLNTVLTVESGAAASHAGRGWENFTDAVIHAVNDQVPHAVFILWGLHAQKKAGFVDEARHLVLRSPHPSGLSARRGFFGSRPFSKANAFLRAQGLAEIDWNLRD